MIFLRRLRVVVAGIAVAVVVVGMPKKIGAQEGQTPKMMPADAHPVFVVAAVKFAGLNEKRDGFDVKGRHVIMENGCER